VKGLCAYLIFFRIRRFRCCWSRIHPSRCTFLARTRQDLPQCYPCRACIVDHSSFGSTDTLVWLVLVLCCTIHNVHSALVLTPKVTAVRTTETKVIIHKVHVYKPFGQTFFTSRGATATLRVYNIHRDRKPVFICFDENCENQSFFGTKFKI
jgi:hypothetical protein